MAVTKVLTNGPPSSAPSQRAIAWEHALIHRGEYFIASDRRNLGNSDAVNYLIRTGNHGVHLDVSAWSGGDLDLDVHSSQTVASPFVGTEMDISNHVLPLTGSRLPECAIFKDVDIVDDGGEPHLERFLPASAGGEVLNQAAGREFVLAANSEYLVHVDNLSNSPVRFSIEFNFYEVER